MENNCLVYFHYRKDTNEVFYVGMASNLNRPYEKRGHNRLWNRIVNKHGYEVKIIKDNITKDQAFTTEMFWIKTFGRVNNQTGQLCNMTDGGDGFTSEDTTGEKNGFYGKRHTEETKEKIRNAAKLQAINNPPSAAARKKMATNTWKGRQHSEETKKKISHTLKNKSIFQ